MDIFSKIYLIMGSLLTLINPNYIEVDSRRLEINRSDADPKIIHTLHVKNVGPERAKFKINSYSEWVLAYREYQPNSQTVESPVDSEFNFILEIYPAQALSDQDQTELVIEVFSLHDYSLLDSEKITVALNQNLPANSQLPLETTPASSTSSHNNTNFDLKEITKLPNLISKSSQSINLPKIKTTVNQPEEVKNLPVNVIEPVTVESKTPWLKSIWNFFKGLF